MDIEFLDPDGDELPVADPAPIPHDRRTGVRRVALPYASAVLLAGAAAFAVVAPFGVIDTITIRQQGQTQREATDGWGRYRWSSEFSALSHGPRYGLVLVGCAAVLAAAAVLALVTALGRRPGPALSRVRTALAVAGAAGLAALVGVLALNYLSTKDALAAQVKSIGSSAPGTLVSDVIRAQVRFGPCMWLAAAALAAALLAIVADLFATPGPAAAAGEPPAPHPQDDLLESGPVG